MCLPALLSRTSRSLNKEFIKIGDSNIESRVLEEILENKSEMVHKIKVAIQKMSKKFLVKLMDYLDLKFKMALINNNVKVEQEKFVTEAEIQEIYKKLIKSSHLVQGTKHIKSASENKDPAFKP